MPLLNADFSQRAIVTPDRHAWAASPQAGVERVMLDRVGAEVARATSLVRYAGGSHFPHHVHGGGEEILVLEGSFAADARHYPAGWYLRSPPGSSHAPYSEHGALLFVKLWQMSPDECDEVRIDTGDPARWVHRDGRERCPLFASEHEQVWLERLRPGQALMLGAVAGAELLVLDGDLGVDGSSCTARSWIRVPPDDVPEVAGGPNGATLYLKTGHLGAVTPPDSAP
jgi:anti-sigma factor ChrR (cupin superfamily)